MFIENFKNDFYMKLRGKRILILVNYDIDAICACKILQSLFNTDGMLYSVICVDLTTDLMRAFQERQADEKHVLLINCGGTLDLVDYLEPTDDIEFYVLDSHRPFDVSNVYSTSQIKFICPPEDIQVVPDFDDVFRDSEDESEEEENSAESLEEQLEKRRKRREWQEKRDLLLFEYHQFTYFSRSSAVMAFDLAWKLSKDSFDLLWYAVIGVSEQLLMNKMNDTDYDNECLRLDQHISRLQKRTKAAPENRGIALSIEYQKQLRLAMHRNWTVEASLLNSVSTATTFKSWTFDGSKKMHEMLAEIGMPLSQCRQKFSSMQTLYKKELHDGVVQAASRYGLSDVEFNSFTLLFGYRAPLPAMDTAYALIGLLIADKAKSERFIDALEALGKSKREELEEGMVICQKLLQTVTRIVQSALEAGQIRTAGDCCYLAIQEENPLFSHPYSLLLLAEFALKAYAGRREGRHKLPLIVSTPFPQAEAESLCHVAAIPPLSADGRSFFGRAFEKAASQSNTDIIGQYFDSTVIQIRLKDRGKFFDSMVALLSN